MLFFCLVMELILITLFKSDYSYFASSIVCNNLV